MTKYSGIFEKLRVSGGATFSAERATREPIATRKGTALSTLDDRGVQRHALGMTTTRASRDDTALAAGDPRWRRLQRVSRLIDRLVVWLDSAIPIPGTRIRIGLDPIIGLLLPGGGDALGGAVSLTVVLLALQYRVPAWMLARMVGNIAIDAAIGGIPVLGDAFDFAWKANERNLAILRSHQTRALPERMPKSYWVVAFLLLMAAVVCAALPIVLSIWLLHAWLGGQR